MWASLSVERRMRKVLIISAILVAFIGGSSTVALITSPVGSPAFYFYAAVGMF